MGMGECLCSPYIPYSLYCSYIPYSPCIPYSL